LGYVFMQCINEIFLGTNSPLDPGICAQGTAATAASARPLHRAIRIDAKKLDAGKHAQRCDEPGIASAAAGP
jgi:hypothetical protein